MQIDLDIVVEDVAVEERGSRSCAGLRGCRILDEQRHDRQITRDRPVNHHRPEILRRVGRVEKSRLPCRPVLDVVGGHVPAKHLAGNEAGTGHRRGIDTVARHAITVGSGVVHGDGGLRLEHPPGVKHHRPGIDRVV